MIRGDARRPKELPFTMMECHATACLITEVP
jgi:hypothetical protein